MNETGQPAPKWENHDDRRDAEDPGLLLRLQLHLRSRLPLHRRSLHLRVRVRVAVLPRAPARDALDHLWQVPYPTVP